MSDPIQPGLLRTFRYFTGVALGYFAILVVFTILQSGQGFSTSQMQLYLNLATQLGLFGYLSWPWLQRKLHAWYLPGALLAATAVPIFSNFFYLVEPMVRDLPLVIVRSWLLFPILMIPLVLIAWQYRFRFVLLFTLITASVELGVLYPVVGRINFETLPILGVPLIRAFAFGTVGHIVTHLITTQQAQSKALLKANLKLSQHAETLERLAVSRERNRLARELHDTLAHTLSGQAVNLEAIKLMLPAEQSEARLMLEQALESTRAGLRETRRALKDLRSLPLEDLGLGLALGNLAREAAARGGFDLSLAIADPLPELSPDAEQCIFRIAQEALENVIRHAGARQVALRLQTVPGSLRMSLQDDGCGIDLADQDFSGKLGLQGMRERAAEAGGTLDIISQPGQGVTIELLLRTYDDTGVNL